MVDGGSLLSVVMPVYSERTTFEDIIRRVLAVRVGIEIVVDNGRPHSGSCSRSTSAAVRFNDRFTK
jgi:hypothetical protein